MMLRGNRRKGKSKYIYMSMIYQNSLWCLGGGNYSTKKIYLLPKISPEPYDCGFDLLACIVASDISANTPFCGYTASKFGIEMGGECDPHGGLGPFVGVLTFKICLFFR